MMRPATPSAITHKGFSLIEILLVLGILAAIFLAAFVVYPSVRAARQSMTELANLQQISGGIKHTFLIRGYQNLDNDLVNQARIFPSNMNQRNYAAGQAITSSWSGPVTVSPSAEIAGMFQVVYEDTPKQVCLEFSRGAAASYERVLIDDVVVRDVVGSPAVEADPVAIVALCDERAPATIRVETY